MFLSLSDSLADWHLIKSKSYQLVCELLTIVRTNFQLKVPLYGFLVEARYIIGGKCNAYGRNGFIKVFITSLFPNPILYLYIMN